MTDSAYDTIPTTKFAIPKFLMGKPSEDSEELWVVRSRGPFLIARIEPNWHFSVWPRDVENQASPDRLYKVIGKLAAHYAEEEDKGPLPASWDYSFDNMAYPPSHLRVWDRRRKFEALLRLDFPKAFFLAGEENFSAVRWLDEPGDNEILYSTYIEQSRAANYY